MYINVSLLKQGIVLYQDHPTLRMYAMGTNAEATVKRVTVLMPPDIHRKLKLLGFEKDTTMNDLILTAVLKYLNDAAVQIEQQEP